MSEEYRCPICNVQKPSFSEMAKHLGPLGEHRRHGSIAPYRCLCGKEFEHFSTFAEHLAGAGELDVHHILVKLKDSAGVGHD